MRKLLLAAAFAFPLCGTAFAQDTVKIGYIDPLSGGGASVGEVGLKTYQFLADELNAKGGILGKKVEIVPLDNKTNPQESLGSSVTYDGGSTWTLLDTAVQHTAVVYSDVQHGWSGGFTSATGTGGVFEYVGMPLAVQHEIVREQAAVFPNPTTGVVRLAGADPRETVMVTDVAGRVIRRMAVPANGQLDLRGLDAGMYQLIITGGSHPRTTRLAVER